MKDISKGQMKYTAWGKMNNIGKDQMTARSQMKFTGMDRMKQDVKYSKSTY